MNAKHERFARKAAPRIFRLAVLSGVLFAGSALFQQPADAYYYPFYYRGLTSLLYPLRYAAYPLIGGYGPYRSWTSATPYRLATGRPPGYPYMYGPQMLKNYTDEEPLSSPRKRVKQKRTGQEFGVDETTHAQWADGDDDARASAPPQSVPPVVPNNAYQQGMLPPGVAPQLGQAPQQVAFSPQTPAAGQFAPPTAPSVVSKGPIALAPNVRGAQPGQAINNNAPLADGFVNQINGKFHGDIEAALFDPETRGWAKLVGLVNDDSMFGMDFSDARVELVKRIFSDSSLDSVSKLNAVKILLNGGANRAKE